MTIAIKYLPWGLSFLTCEMVTGVAPPQGERERAQERDGTLLRTHEPLPLGLLLTGRLWLFVCPDGGYYYEPKLGNNSLFLQI